MTDIMDRLDAPDADRWEPEEGDRIAGTIIEIVERNSDFGPFPVLTVETDDGLVDIACARTVLRNEVEARDPQVGDKIGVKYLGELPAKKAGGKPFHGYKVVIVRGSGHVSSPSPTSAPSPAAVTSADDLF